MPNHVRRQLREAAAAALTGLATTGARVYPSRLYVMGATELPGLRIYTASETASSDDVGADALYQRTVQLRIEAVAKAVAGLDDTLDAMAKEVEVALSANLLTLTSGQRAWLVYRSAETELSVEGDQPAGIVTLHYEATIYTHASTPDVAA